MGCALAASCQVDSNMKTNIDNYNFIDKDFEKLIEEVSKDVNIIFETIKNNDNQTWRRAYIRAVFSSIESIIFNMKKYIKEVGKNDFLPLSELEQKKLNEFYSEKATDGKEIVKIFRLSFLENITFTIDLFAFANYLSMNIDKNSTGWELLKESVKIRNRITHPKNLQDIFIRKVELNKVFKAHNWFINTIINLHMDSYKELMAQINGLEKAFAKGKKST